jgi:phage head maturation protease
MTVARSPSQNYLKGMLALMVAQAEQTNDKNARRFMNGHVHSRLEPSIATSFDNVAGTAVACLSRGSPCRRVYGTEVLKISPAAVILTRVENGGIPLLDSHNQFALSGALGRVIETWVEAGALLGKLKFNQTKAGQDAAGMVERKEITGVSVGYRVEEWEITTQDGTKIDPEVDRVRFDDDLTFTAARWELLECSLVTVPADPMATIRSHLSSHETAARAAAAARKRMLDRHVPALGRATRDRERFNTDADCQPWRQDGAHGRNYGAHGRYYRAPRFF